MADTFPVTVQTTLVTFGRYYAPDASIDRSGQVNISLDRELYLVGSGDVIEPIVVGAVPQTDGQYQIRLPKTGQPGVVDANGTPISIWYYTATWVGFKYQQKRPVKFDLPASLGDVVDGDRFSPAVTPPTVIPTPTYVTSVTVGGIAYPGPAVVLPGGIGGGAGDVDSIVGATDLGKSLLKSGDAYAALTQLGIAGLSALVVSQGNAISALQSQLIALQASLTSGLNGKVDKTAVGVSVAPLDSSAKLPVANLSPQALLIAGNGENRAASGNRTVFATTTAPPLTGTTAGGSAAAVNGLDFWWG